jgi:flagellar hook assembly protein FlgD
VGDVSAGSEITEVMGAYPNPYDPESGPLRLLFTLSRSAEVTVRIYTVSGRLVRGETLAGTRGPNAFRWDGRDGRGDPVANGVYLVLLSTGEKDPQRRLERLVVLR